MLGAPKGTPPWGSRGHQRAAEQGQPPCEACQYCWRAASRRHAGRGDKFGHAGQYNRMHKRAVAERRTPMCNGSLPCLVFCDTWSAVRTKSTIQEQSRFHVAHTRSDQHRSSNDVCLPMARLGLSAAEALSQPSVPTSYHHLFGHPFLVSCCLLSFLVAFRACRRQQGPAGWASVVHNARDALPCCALPRPPSLRPALLREKTFSHPSVVPGGALSRRPTQQRR